MGGGKREETGEGSDGSEGWRRVAKKRVRVRVRESEGQDEGGVCVCERG